MTQTNRQTNRAFSKDPLFVAACNFAEVQPTTRQASKFRNRKGRAHAAARQFEQEIREQVKDQEVQQ